MEVEIEDGVVEDVTRKWFFEYFSGLEVHWDCI